MAARLLDARTRCCLYQSNPRIPQIAFPVVSARYMLHPCVSRTGAAMGHSVRAGFRARWLHAHRVQFLSVFRSAHPSDTFRSGARGGIAACAHAAVSYTHLTLPTILLV